ncbi:MAG: LicD family protein [Actinomycetia bacterium]|nr:LicD family protein [Actinomycetes bacterium]
MRKYLSSDEIKYHLNELLKVFAAFCEEHDLRYSLFGGTLLGAVRHQGFIPWDDDIDVLMPRPDYEKFLVLADQLLKGFSVITHENSALDVYFAKLQNLDIRSQEPVYVDVVDEYLWLDIFPLDGVPAKVTDYLKVAKRIRSLQRKRKWLAKNVVMSTKSVPKRLIKAAYFFFNDSDEKRAKFETEINKLLRAIPYDDAERVAVPSSVETLGWSILREELDFDCYMLFEGEMYRVISDWRNYLEVTYGDYMTPPSEKNRVNHGVSAWIDGQ